MRIRAWRAESFRPWVESVAVHIGDPVARLRFLRIAAPVAPAMPAPDRGRLRSRIVLSVWVSLAGLSAMLVFLFLALYCSSGISK